MPAPPPADATSSLRAEQVRQTRAALVAAGRRLFGERGFAPTSVDDLAAEARVTTGALYHHFPTKTALFETVFEAVHDELLIDAGKAAAAGTDELDELRRGIDAFLDAALVPEIQRIIVIDAPAVLGVARYTELDEQHALGAVVAMLQAAKDAGRIEVDDCETLATLLMGALTRGAMLIANSKHPRRTRNAVSAAMAALLT